MGNERRPGVVERTVLAHEFRPDHPDLGVLLEHVDEPVERRRVELAVGVEEKHELVARAADAEVRRLAEAEIRVRLERHRAGEDVPHERGGVGVVAVVDDHDVELLRAGMVTERLEAAPEAVVGVVGDDDDVHGVEAYP